MNGLINLSEGVSIAIRGLVVVAKEYPNRLNIKRLARELQASEAHLSKIFQQLSKAGIVKSVRGPAGGFELCEEMKEISFLDIFEIIEGRIKKTICPFSKRKCEENSCIYGVSLCSISQELNKAMGNVKLIDFLKNKKTNSLKKVVKKER